MAGEPGIPALLPGDAGLRALLEYDVDGAPPRKDGEDRPPTAALPLIPAAACCLASVEDSGEVGPTLLGGEIGDKPASYLKRNNSVA